MVIVSSIVLTGSSFFLYSACVPEIRAGMTINSPLSFSNHDTAYVLLIMHICADIAVYLRRINIVQQHYFMLSV